MSDHTTTSSAPPSAPPAPDAATRIDEALAPLMAKIKEGVDAIGDSIVAMFDNLMTKATGKIADMASRAGDKLSSVGDKIGGTFSAFSEKVSAPATPSIKQQKELPSPAPEPVIMPERVKAGVAELNFCQVCSAAHDVTVSPTSAYCGACVSTGHGGCIGY